MKGFKKYITKDYTVVYAKKDDPRVISGELVSILKNI